MELRTPRPLSARPVHRIAAGGKTRFPGRPAAGPGNLDGPNGLSRRGPRAASCPTCLRWELGGTSRPEGGSYSGIEPSVSSSHAQVAARALDPRTLSAPTPTRRKFDQMPADYPPVSAAVLRAGCLRTSRAGGDPGSPAGLGPAPSGTVGAVSSLPRSQPVVVRLGHARRLRPGPERLRLPRRIRGIAAWAVIRNPYFRQSVEQTKALRYAA